MLKIIDKSISKGGQAVVYTEVMDMDGIAKVRIKIKSDSYDFQSYAYCEVFSPTELKWNRLAEIHYGVMKTESKLVYLPRDGGLAEARFKADRDELLRQAWAIIGSAS